MGVVRPAHCTALGKIILAALRPEQLDAFFERAELKAFTAKSITDAAALRREIDDVRRAGIAFDDGEFDPELRCVGVPVKDFSGRLIGAIGISGPIWRLSIQALQSRAKLVEAAAARLSAEFGAINSFRLTTLAANLQRHIDSARKLVEIVFQQYGNASRHLAYGRGSDPSSCEDDPAKTSHRKHGGDER